MAVRIRMARIGRTNRPYYRIAAYPSRNARNGRSLEILGSYDPLVASDKQMQINTERLQYWLSVGAKPTHKTASILKKNGFVFPKKQTTSSKKKQQ